MKIRYLIVVFTLLISTGCVYKINIQQGNEITEEMVSKIEIGMSRREVVKVLGYPLVNDPFHKDRWDYFYSLNIGETGERKQHSASLIFEEGTLIQINDAVTAVVSE